MRKGAKQVGRYWVQSVGGGYEVLDANGKSVRFCTTRQAAIDKCWELTRRDAKADGSYGQIGPIGKPGR